jgi:hypothetical protein
MSMAVTARLAAGESPVVEAALIKDLGTELEQLIPQWSTRLGGDPATPALEPS